MKAVKSRVIFPKATILADYPYPAHLAGEADPAYPVPLATTY